jgi:hypothetical protein
MVEHDEIRGYLVWDLTMGNLHDLSEPDIKWLVYAAAVICVVDGCNHLDCHVPRPLLINICVCIDIQLVYESVCVVVL